jgi:hypothetical protein
MTNKPTGHQPLTRGNAVLLLVDHQVGLYTGVRDIDTLELKHNVVGLTKALRVMKIPVVVTTTTEKMWGPLIPALAEALQDVLRIERTTVNAWTEKRVVDAVKATGHKQLIVTGISTNVCLVSGNLGTRRRSCHLWRGRRVRRVYKNAGRARCDADDAGRRGSGSEAQVVHGALGIPFVSLVYGLNTSKRSVPRG